MVSPLAAPLNRVISAVVPAVAAGSDSVVAVGVAGEDATVTAVTYVPNAAITGAATNNRTCSVIDKKADGSGAVAVASKTYANGTNDTAYIENPETLNGTPANLQVSQGDVLVFSSVHAGTGIADPGGIVRVSLTRR